MTHVVDERAALVGIETATGFLTIRDVAAHVTLFADLHRVAELYR